MTAPVLAPAGGLGRMWALPGVYVPQEDTLLLARAMRREGVGPGRRVLDLCTGSGALAVHAARLGADVTAVDIGRRAVTSTRVNALLAGRRVTVRRGDLTAAVAPGSRFDLVVSNPPYVPAPSAEVPRRGRARSWDAGPRGRLLLDRICDAAPGLLRPHGVLLLVHSALCDPRATVDRLAGAGLRASVVDRDRIALGPVMRSRAGWLRDQGLLAPGNDKEELVVVRAERI
ncbi:class I SAM-dependent methyltransferase [Streptomyces sp. SL13]|uniref:Class I SAM-dependent methyltransferase n=1 Tax=Streptantibioticus silvisoli TaxID=2705255 RepID=A0AA90H6V5_9ACTN|nr:HemK2/MTQ2 family protein methyltransferase [Streptantibioticus silvisoli]MDI5972038.1 class I SAM-dependent methyltransferase [Streptantibioticus silvisoli]